VLEQIFQNQILEKEGFFQYLPLIGSAVAGDIADQIMNMFGFDNPNMYGSTAWLSAGDANVVSPDNIRWWKAPCFGYVETLQYLPQHTEQYTVSRWKQVVSRCTISGTMTLPSGAPAAGAHVWVYDGKDAYCDAQGRYQIDDVPVGPYTLQASVLSPPGSGIEYSASYAHDFTAATNPVSLVLQTAAIDFRRLDLVYQVSCDHGDASAWPFRNQSGICYGGPDSQSGYLNPGQVTTTVTYDYDYGSGGLFNIQYAFNLTLAEDLSIEVALVATMYGDGGGGPVGQWEINFNVPLGGQYAWTMTVEQDGVAYHNGPAVFIGTATNNQQTG
jgi:hypothetical protein